MSATDPVDHDPVLLHQLIARQASRDPAALALWWRGEATDYATLHQRVQRVAARVAAGGNPGDRVAVLAWNCPAFIELMYGVPAAGRIFVPLNARLAAAELLYQLQASGASHLFADPALLAPLTAHDDFPADLAITPLDGDYAAWRDCADAVALPTPAPQDPAWILFTSGSTGRPKGAVLTHRSFMAGLDSAAMARPVVAGDRYYYPFPLFHVSAHNVMLQHREGAAVVLARAFDAGDTLAACRSLRVTTLSLAPTMIAMLLDHPDFDPADLAAVRTIGYGASAMPRALLRRLQSLSAVGLCQSYGMTELSGSVAFLTVEDHRRAAQDRPELLASVGRPLPTAEIRLLGADGTEAQNGENGEILVRGAQCMAGYWNDAAASAAALAGGWLHTGDIGRFDADGYLYIVDRKKDMIVSGGENVASREVEDVLLQHPAVRACAVIGLPDERWGERVSAVLVLSGPVTDEALQAHCRTSLAGYKTPKRWLRTEQLPLNAAGKVDKPLLRRQFAAAG